MPVGPEGSVDRPYRENPPEHLKEVHWGGGLAVHFFAGAGPEVPAEASARRLALRLPGRR